MKAITKLLAAAACAAPLAASAQSPSPAQGELVVITVTPVVQRVMDEQRRESLFRAIDANGDGQISLAEAGVNTQLVNAFRNLDSNGNRAIDRQEWARVHVDDGSRHASAEQNRAASGQSASPTAREPSGRLPSRSIEERSKFSIPGESVPPNTPGQPAR